jgi:hypothetical protein
MTNRAQATTRPSNAGGQYAWRKVTKITLEATMPALTTTGQLRTKPGRYRDWSVGRAGRKGQCTTRRAAWRGRYRPSGIFCSQNTTYYGDCCRSDLTNSLSASTYMTHKRLEDSRCRIPGSLAELPNIIRIVTALEIPSTRVVASCIRSQSTNCLLSMGSEAGNAGPWR